MAVLTVEGLTLRFRKNSKSRGKLTIVDDVSFEVEENEIFGIVGESGSGKTTLSRGILSLIKDRSGKVTVNGRDTEKMSAAELSENIQMIFQNPQASFNPHYTIKHSLTETAKVHKLAKDEYESRVSELMGYMGLTDSMAERYPRDLSGGQLQRFAICRALLIRPKILIADEAVSALDVSIQNEILKLLLRLRKQLGITIIFISHDLNVVEKICDRVAVLYLGKIMELSPSRALFDKPLHPYTKLLLDSRSKTDPDEVRKTVHRAEDIPSIIEVPTGCRFSSRCAEFSSGICDKGACGLVRADGEHFTSCLRHIS
ncbi:peptide/nickel transport system ATP-binding protein [Ruminococcus sp. YE71]|uniref:ABC transporter ATP-binding protein n=1 Tax=unclassified Ruminococcus TaxID=2608920 RepID=UPI0008830ACD|nr:MULTISPECIES: ABC transporter ATP-binding protein [unclassified Ruminococcus]SDA21798.1 peptide/nickel transport system ATP-binding protein [Ruminococcus sp. YE78]SFW36896.1 peptide/nickel transport system ATP-binding protein [Ruminococcus sp. YE71]